MGKKSRRKKSGAAAIDIGSIDITVCAVCGVGVNPFHWNQRTSVLLSCCGRLLCRNCIVRKEKEKQDTDKKVSNHVLPNLVKIALPPCPACGAAAAKSETETCSRVQRLAEAGHVHAQFFLAYMLKFGEVGLRKDPKVAIGWLQKAAEGGHSLACARMGECLHLGDGVAQSYEEARKWYERAPENALALHGLATLYREGKGAEKNQAKAVQLYRMSAEQGLPKGLSDYGTALYTDDHFEEALVQFETCARMEELLSHDGERKVIAHCQLFTARSLINIHREFLEGKDTREENDPLPLAFFWARRAAKNGKEEANEWLASTEPVAFSRCRNCRKPNPKSKCTKCRAVCYCDRNCQAIHWKAGHKTVCSSLPVLCRYSEDECAQCGKRMPEYMCQGCGKANYCNEKCQKIHWKGDHQDECAHL